MLYAGTDEAGVGALAGPIVAVTVTLEAPAENLKELRAWWPLEGVNDSKQLSEAQRERLRDALSKFLETGAVGVAVIPVTFINENGYAKSLNKMLADSVKEATKSVGLQPKMLIIDGTRHVPGYPWRQEAIPKADGQFFHVAAASIIAKLLRDDVMVELSQEYPQYGWDRNKGYPTIDHRDALLEHGLCDMHRKQPCETVLRKVRGPRRRPEGW